MQKRAFEPKSIKFWQLAGLLLVFCLAIGTVYRYYFMPYPADLASIVEEIKSNRIVTASSSNKISSVVNILCGGSTVTGGSGIVINQNGLVLTNYHNIADRTEDNCLVTIPDPQTGRVSEIYTARPIVAPELSAEYDLAFVVMNKPYSDLEGVYGAVDKVFATYAGCRNDNPEIGEPVRVYGYPYVGGSAFNLIATDGIVSSVPDEKTVITSAKVSVGNSGGLAVDEDGCVVGMPSMIDVNEYTSLGVVTPDSVLREFVSLTRDFVPQE